MASSFRKTAIRGCAFVASLLVGISTAASSSSDTTRQVPPPGGGNHPRPPAEAFAACKGKAAGTTCSISTPRGTLSGTCVAPGGKSSSDSLSCMPSQPPPGGQGGSQNGSAK